MIQIIDLANRLRSFKIKTILNHGTVSSFIPTHSVLVEISDCEEVIIIIIDGNTEMFIPKEDIVDALDCVNRENHIQITFKNGDYIEFFG